MKSINIFVLITLLFLFFIKKTSAQERSYEDKIELLEEKKEKIIIQEKEALKVEVESINKKLQDYDITKDEASKLKEAAAKKRALNIEDRIAIIDNKIALLKRNKGEGLVLKDVDSTGRQIRFGVDIKNKDGSVFVFNKRKKVNKDVKYDRRTYSDFVFAIGLNNTLIENESIENTPYKVAGSRFFEMGWQWRTRVFKNSNFLRFNYGVSFQYNGLKPKNNQYFVINNGEATLQEFQYNLRKSKLRIDNLVFPVHLELGSSRKSENEDKFRYSLQDQFRFGIGGYGGFNLGTRQKLKYERAGENVKDKLKRGYNTSDFIYGVSGYVGFDGVLLYAKYDLNPLFKNASVEQHNISLGLRFDL